MPDSERGFLTPSDRSFLDGGKDYEYIQSAINKRRTIRARTREGLSDLEYLHKLEEADREKLVEELGGLENFEKSIASLLRFLYEVGGHDPQAIGGVIEQALYGAEYPYQQGLVDGVDVEIGLSHSPDLDHLEERFEKEGPESLSPRGLGLLIRDGRVDVQKASGEDS